MNPIQQRSDISITSLFNAVQKPNSSSSQRCKDQIKTASTKEIDYTFRKINQYLKHKPEEWPKRRLLRCIDFLLENITQLKDTIALPSLLKTIGWTLDTLHEQQDESNTTDSSNCPWQHTIQIAIKVCTKVLEKTRSLEPIRVLNLLSKFREHVQVIFDWSINPTLDAVRIYAQRALLAHASYFAPILLVSVNVNVYQALFHQLDTIPSLLHTLSLRPVITDHTEKRAELERLVMYARLLEAISKHECVAATVTLITPSEIETEPLSAGKSRKEIQGSHTRSLTAFSDSEQGFDSLLHLWESVSKNYCDGLVKYKNQSTLLYSLTSVIHRCIQVSQHANNKMVQQTRASATLLMLIDELMRHWVRDVCCSMHPPLQEPAILETEKNVLKKLLCICIVLPIPKGDSHVQFWNGYISHLLYNTVNFFMCYVAQPVSPEESTTIGTEKCISTDMCIDVDERGYMVTLENLNQHHDLLNLCLEVFIQHIQLSHSSAAIIKPLIAGRIAWCIKSNLTILIQHEAQDQPYFQSLIHRLVKMSIYFLHFDQAIDVLATSSTNITTYLWGPTIEQAKRGLVMASSLTPESTLSKKDEIVIYKAKRAFVSLKKISNHPRACERLVDCDVLQLVKQEYIPSGQAIEKVKALLDVYALFGQCIASLLHRMAFVRTRLRDEVGLFPIIIQLLNEAVNCRESKRSQQGNEKMEDLLLSWNSVVLGCLSVACTFQYDETSMKMWLLHNQLLPLIIRILRQPVGCDLERFWRTDKHVLLLASGLLEQFTVLPLCGRQIVMEEDALVNLARLFTSLVTFGHSDHGDSDGDGDVKMLDQDQDNSTEFNIPKEDEDEDHHSMDQQEVDSIEHNSNHGDDENDDDNDDLFNQKIKNNGFHRQHQKEPRFVCAEYLRKSIVKILTCHDNMQFIILSDAYTKAFEPLTNFRFIKQSQTWRHRVSIDLYQKKMKDLQTLYNFTDNTDDAMKLHELTAVAIGYATIGAPTPGDWNSALGLTLEGGKGGGGDEETTAGVLKNMKQVQDIISITTSTTVFGMFCQMLVFELEEDEQVEGNDDKKEGDQQIDMTVSVIKDKITPFRRHAAAQVIESLALEFINKWKEKDIQIIQDIVDEWKTIRQQQQQQSDITNEVTDVSIKKKNDIEEEKEEEKALVRFKADDSDDYITSNRSILRTQSPIFEAMLSTIYVESTLEVIPIHDVTFHNLGLFIKVIHQIQQEQHATHPEVHVIDPETSWIQVIRLLQIADRFDTISVKKACEYWIMQRIQLMDKGNSAMKEEEILQGLLLLYRMCKDPIEPFGGIVSETWPFSIMLHAALRTIVLHLQVVCQTDEFMKMVQENNQGELELFCDGIAFLLTCM